MEWSILLHGDTLYIHDAGDCNVCLYTIKSWPESDPMCAVILCRAKPKGSICLLYKSSDTAFWLCRDTHDESGTSRSVQRTRDVQPLLVQSWANVFDAGPTLYQHWLNVSCLMGVHQINTGENLV